MNFWRRRTGEKGTPPGGFTKRDHASWPMKASPKAGKNGEHVSEDTDIDDFFRDNDRPSISLRYFIYFVIFASVLSSALYLFLAYYIPSKPPERSWMLLFMNSDNAARASTAFSFIASISTSLAASIFAIEVVNRTNVRRLDFAKGLANVGVLKALFKILKGYNGRISENKKIEAVFDKILTSKSGRKIATCTLTVRQRTKVVRNTLTLDFVKLDRDKEARSSLEVSLLDIAVPDDLYSVDVTDIKDEFPDHLDDIMLGVSEVIIDSDIQTMERQDISETRTRWSVDTKKYIDRNMVDIEYRYKFALEVPGFTFFNVSEPTRGFTCILDTSAISGQLAVYNIELLNSKVFKHDVNSAQDRVALSTSDWIIPKSSVVFVWYPK